MDAVAVQVSGFNTELNGNRVVKVLERFGFTIKERLSPDSDSNGGLVETNIMNADDVEGDYSDPEYVADFKATVGHNVTVLTGNLSEQEEQ